MRPFLANSACKLRSSSRAAAIPEALALDQRLERVGRSIAGRALQHIQRGLWSRAELAGARTTQVIVA
jgi:hypothetical protein